MTASLAIPFGRFVANTAAANQEFSLFGFFPSIFSRHSVNDWHDFVAYALRTIWTSF
jgi:hypothetical protein